MQGFVDWFVGLIQGFILWEIGIITADPTSMVLWMSAFNVLAFSFFAMAVWGGQKMKPIVIVTVIVMFLVGIVTVALVTGQST